MQMVNSLPCTSALAIVLLTSGCATRERVNSDSVAERETPVSAVLNSRQRIEDVFRLQNRAMSKLIENDAHRTENSATRELELKIVESCRYLNESASLHMEGKSLPMELQKNVLLSVDECENAALAAEQALSSEESIGGL